MCALHLLLENHHETINHFVRGITCKLHKRQLCGQVRRVHASVPVAWAVCSSLYDSAQLREAHELKLLGVTDAQ
ncbi:MAG TPA: hypothetical protein DCR21_05020 [Succinivibrionaceae bacterium]|nr:hypothetical protein [Succinivibrionaceae bacterium]